MSFWFIIDIYAHSNLTIINTYPLLSPIIILRVFEKLGDARKDRKSSRGIMPLALDIMVKKPHFFQYLVFVIFAQWILVSEAFSEQKKITIHAVHYPPYSIEKSQGKDLRGFDVEVVIEAFRRVSINAKVEFMPWSRILLRTEQGKTAAALSCAKDPSRDHYIFYSKPISHMTNSYIAKQDYQGEIPRTLRDGIGKKIVVVSGYVNELELKKAEVPYHPVLNDHAALNILLKRNIDFFYSGREFIKYITAGKSTGSELRYFDMPDRVPLHLCFSKNWPASKFILAKFNKGLAVIKSDGTYDKIHAKYQ
ncbi:hypothetical protein WH96_05875 [Kiloniella spongiae]|uniref:Solute-binding protein family 3/N-terminal domain-containing protein n=1 Tax=Kiloniella spongiae TaxID=1489064 RepID=A0A0H2MYK4_9PROT|nr:transporter substrate-binding domain-containing protein [Kiloniella spongiae]KLN61815.1 hypothetical protein WH96_05875 [Kiloniella spongiae]